MKFIAHRFVLPLLLGASLLIAACSEAPGSKAAGAGSKAAAAPVSTSAISAESTGFPVGSSMSARTVYVFFDAQCPHCSELWRNAKPLKSQAKFVWIPVGLLNAASTSQGATLLASKDPVGLMDEHEASMLAKRGGISAGSDIDTQRAAVAKNTELLNRFGFASIPTIVGTHAETGVLVTNEGSMSTAALASASGLADTGRTACCRGSLKLARAADADHRSVVSCRLCIKSASSPTDTCVSSYYFDSGIMLTWGEPSRLFMRH